MKITSGELRHLVSITLRQTTGQDDRGQDEYTVVVIGEVYAKIEPLTGRKLEIARQVVASASHEITIRVLSGVTPECKVIFEERIFEIGSVVKKSERNFEMVLTCIERQ